MSDTKSKRGKLVVISGPSGVGKTTICRELVKLIDANLSVSATTRPRSPQETEGVDYYFISKDEFEKRIDEEQFLEYARVFDNYYGTPGDKVEENLKAGKTVILEIDIQGGMQIKRICPDAIMIFVLPPNSKDLMSRTSGRGRDSAQAIKARLAKADEEIATAWRFYKYMVVNDDLEEAIKEITAIIKTHGDSK